MKLKVIRTIYSVDQRWTISNGIVILKNAYCIFKADKFTKFKSEFTNNFIFIYQYEDVIITKASETLFISYWDEWWSGLLLVNANIEIVSHFREYSYQTENMIIKNL